MKLTFLSLDQEGVLLEALDGGLDAVYMLVKGL